MKKILVPTDFSPASRNATEYAVQLAKIFHAEIYLLHVFMEPLPAAEAPVAWMITGSELQDAKEELMTEEVNYLHHKYSIVVNGTAVIGHKGTVIHEIAKEINADMVVMGMKEEKRSRIAGSTTFIAIRKAGVPVLIIPEHALFVPLKHIIVASDFNEVEDVSTFQQLLKIADQFSASLQVIHIQKKGLEMAASEVPGKMQLGRVFSKYSFLYQEVEDYDVEHGILNFVQNHPADILVMMAHHHSIFERIFGTIYTQEVSMESKLPVLVLSS